MRSNNSEYENLQDNGNGILCCYNLFPRKFLNLNEMKKYLKIISSMGFNAVWINPIQESGGVKKGEFLTRMDKNNGVWENNIVTKSIYAMKNHEKIEPELLNFNNLNQFVTDENKLFLIQENELRAFTNEAKNNNLAPIFDLVLNHIAADSLICKKYPKWFCGTDPCFRDAEKFNYSDDMIRKEIVEILWKPYIFKYMIKYGFDGVRVDAVFHVHQKVREEVYDYIYQLCEKHNKPKPIIFEEVLFSQSPIEEEIDHLILLDSSPTHITASTYFALREPYSSGLPEWVKKELGYKSKVIFMKNKDEIRAQAKGGTVNFTGNHDHQSLASTLLCELAYELLEKDIQMKQLYDHVIKTIDHNGSIKEDESRKLKILYPYMRDIKEQIFRNQIMSATFEMKMLERIAICAFQSSGGWYALCGDEYGDFSASSVFLRENKEAMYSGKTHKIFRNLQEETQNALNDALKIMAISLIKKDKVSIENQIKLSHNGMYGIYLDLANHPEKQNKLLSSYIDNIKHQINSKIPKTTQKLFELLRKRNINISFNNNDYDVNHYNYKNHWDSSFNLTDYIKKINGILQKLPSSQSGFWTELITIHSQPNLIAVVRSNGMGLDSPTALVIMNQDKNIEYSIDKAIIHEIACEFQKRVVYSQDWYIGNDNFDKAYMKIIQADFYIDPDIELCDGLINRAYEDSNKLLTKNASI